MLRRISGALIHRFREKQAEFFCFWVQFFRFNIGTHRWIIRKDAAINQSLEKFFAILGIKLCLMRFKIVGAAEVAQATSRIRESASEESVRQLLKNRGKAPDSDAESTKLLQTLSL